MTIRKALRLSTLLGCIVASLVYAKAQDAAPAAAPEAQPQSEAKETVAAQEQANIRFQFAGIPYMAVVERFAQMVDKPLLTDVKLEGTVDFSDPEPYTYEEALDTLNLILSMKDAVLVEQDRYLRLVPYDKMLKKVSVRVLRNLEERGDVRPGEIVTTVLQFEHLNPNDIAQSVTTMLSNAGSVVPMTRGKGLIITDVVENVERIKNLMTLADVEPPADRQMQTFHIQSASGPVLTDLINRTFGVATAPVRTRFNDQEKRFIPLPPSPEDYLTAIWDNASRTMVVFGPIQRIKLAEELIKRFESNDGTSPSDVRIFYPKHIPVTELAGILRQTVSGIANPGENADTASTKARLLPDPKLGRLIIFTPISSQMDSIEKVIAKVDASALQKEGEEGKDAVGEDVSTAMKIFYPKRVTATELSATLRQTLIGIAGPADPEMVAASKIRLVVDTKMDRLIVMTPSEKELKTVVEMVEKIDSLSDASLESGASNMQIFYPHSTPVTELAATLRQMMPNEIAGATEPASTAVAKIRLIIEPRLERLIVMSPNQEGITKVEEAISEIDTLADGIGADDATSVIRIFYPKKVDVTELSNMLRQTLSNIAKPDETPAKAAAKIRLIVDTRLSRIIAVAPKVEMFDSMAEVIKQIDTAGEAKEASLNTKIIYPNKFSAQELSNMLRQMVPGIAAQGEPETTAASKVKLLVDTKLNRLIISTAVPGQMETVEEAIALIDSPKGTEGGTLDAGEMRIIYPKNMTAAELSTMLSQTLDFIAAPGESTSTKAKVIVDPKKDRLLITATEEQLQKIDAVVAKVDIAGEAKEASLSNTKIIYPNKFSAQELANMLRQMVSGIAAPGEPESTAASKVKLLVDTKLNRLIVSTAAPGQMENIEEAIALIDSSKNAESGAANAGEMKIVYPKTMTAAELSTMLNQTLDFIAAPGESTSTKAKIIIDPKQDRLLITATEEQLKDIEAVIAKVDTDENGDNVAQGEKTAENRIETAVVRLEYGVAGEIASLLEKSFNDRRASLKVMVDERSNSLVLNGRASLIDAAKMIAEELDVSPSTVTGRHIRFIEIEGDVYYVANLAQQLLQEQLKNENKLNSAAERRKAQQNLGPRIIPEPYTSRLVICCTEEELAMIKKIIDEVDFKKSDTTGIKIFKMRNVNVYEMSNYLNYYLNANRSKQRAAGSRPAVFIDSHNNSLVVCGSESDLRQASTFIDELDVAQYKEERIIKVFRIQQASTYQQSSRLQALYRDHLSANPADGMPSAIFMPDDITGTLTVAASKSQMSLIEDILKVLEETDGLGVKGEFRRYKLKTDEPWTLVSVVNSLLNAEKRPRSQRPYVTLMGGGLLIYGSPADLAKADKLVEELDTPVDTDPKEMRSFTVKRNDIWDLCANVRSLYRGAIVKGGKGIGTADAVIFPNGDSLFVVASSKQMPLIEELIQKLDGESKLDSQLHIFKLKYSDVQQLYPIVSHVVYSRGGSRTRGSANAMIRIDVPRNSFVIFGSQKDIEQVQKLLDELDKNDINSEREVKTYRVTSRNIWRLIEGVQVLYRDMLKGKPDLGIADAIFLPDPTAAKVTVAASAAQMPLIDEVMKKVCEKPELDLQLVLLPVKNTNNYEMVGVVNNFLNMRREQRNGPNPWLFCENKNNGIYVFGMQEDIDYAKELIAKFDEVGEGQDRVIKTYELGISDIWTFTSNVRQLYMERLKGGGGMGRADAFMMPDSNSGCLIIAAREVQFPVIDEVIKILQDQTLSAEPTLKIFKVRSARPSKLVPLISSVLTSKASRGSIAIRINPDDTENKIIASGSARDMERIEKLIKQLDIPEIQEERNIRIFDVKSWDVWSYSSRLRQLYLDQIKGLQDPGVADALILPDDAGRLIVAANKPQMELLEKLMTQLEGELPESELELKTYHLQNVYPAQAMELIRPLMYSAERVFPHSRNMKEVFTMQPDTKANNLIVVATKHSLAMFEKILKLVDQTPEKSDREVRFYTLINADAYDLELRLDDIFNATSTGPEQILFESDILANTLTVVAREKDFVEIEEMIQKMDSISRDLTRVVKLIPVTGMPVEQMMDVLQNIYPQISPGSIDIVEKLPTPEEENRTFKKDTIKSAPGKNAPAAVAPGGNPPPKPAPEAKPAPAPATGTNAPAPQVKAPEVAKVPQASPAPKADNAPEAKKATPEEIAAKAKEKTAVYLASDDKSNTLLVSGPSFEVDRIRSIVSQLQSSFIRGGYEIRMIKLKEADPVLVARTMTTLFRPGEKEDQVETPVRRRGWRGFQQQQDPQAGPGQPEGAPPSLPKAVIVPENRTRSLIIRAKPSDFAAIESIVNQLDAEGIDSLLEHKMIRLENADPTAVLSIVNQAVRQLNIVRPGDPYAVAADSRTRSMFVIARDKVMEKVTEIIADLDADSETAQMDLKVYNLKYVSGSQMGALLRDLTQSSGGFGRFGGGRGGATAQVRRINLKDSEGKEIELDLGKPIRIITDTSAAGMNRILVASVKVNFAALDEVIRQLDRELPADMKGVRIIPLKNADAAELTASLQRFINERSRGAGWGGGEVRTTIFADNRSNSLIIGGSSTNMELVAQLAEELDNSESTLMNNIRMVPLQHSTAQRISQTMTTLFQRRVAASSGRGQKNRTVILPDVRSNSLLIAAGEEDNKLIDELLAKLDRPMENDNLQPTIITLKHNNAARVMQTIRSLFNARLQILAQAGQQTDPQDRVTVEQDLQSNSLIIFANQDNLATIQGLIDKLDNEEAVQLDSIRAIPLQHSTAQRIATTITSLLQRRVAASSDRGLRNRSVVMADVRSNSLLVAAGADDNKLIDDLVAKLDQPMANDNLQPTVITLKHNDASRIMQTIRSLFNARLQILAQAGQQADPQDRVTVEQDLLSNSLIIFANQDNLATIQGLIDELDVEPMSEGVVQTFTLKYADVQRVTTMLRTLVQQGVYRPGSPTSGMRGSSRNSLAIVSDVPSNTLIISASPENMALAKELITEVDTEENAQYSDVRTYPVKHAKVARLATTLDQFFRNKRSAERSVGLQFNKMPLTISYDERSNNLLVTAGKEDVELLEKMISELDVAEAETRIKFNIYPLKNSTAAKMQPILQRLFQNRPQRVRGESVEPITIVADSWANSLIIGCGPDDQSMVDSLVSQLDKPESDAMKVHVFQMAHADAQRVATTIQALMRGQASGYGGGNITISSDIRTNAIIVSAGESDIKRIEELVSKLDTEAVDKISEVKIIPLSHARASETATILNSVLNRNPQSLNEGSSARRQSLLQFVTELPNGEKMISSALHEGILITPDPRSNSLVVSAPVDYMEFLEAMVKSMDQGSPQEAKIRIFSLKNADARQMAQVLTALFRLQATGTAAQREIQYTLVKPTDGEFANNASTEGGEGTDGEKSAVVGGSAEQQALTVTIDLRTNTVLVGGTEHYVALASEIIETLDSHPAQERHVEVYHLRNARATDIETALKTFLQADLNRTLSILGQSGAGAAQTILDRDVSIVAETTNNSLLISASPRYFSEVQKLIEDLDQPLPQVLIQVVLAEVTLDSNTQLGVEWMYKDSVGNTPFAIGTDFGLEDAVAAGSTGGFIPSANGSKVNFFLQALQEDGRLEVLSRPQILTADNVEANVNIGDSVPIVTSTSITDQNTHNNQFTYRDVGVELTVTPRISPDGTVKMEVEPSISKLTSKTVEISEGFEVQIISQRSAKTTVSVQSGQSVVIGGLISTTDDSRTKKVPWIGNVPVLGALFRSKTYQNERKELLIVLTPQILTPDAPIENSGMSAKDVTNREYENSAFENEMRDDPLQEKILRGIVPPEIYDAEPDPKDDEKKVKRQKNYTRQLLIDP